MAPDRLWRGPRGSVGRVFRPKTCFAALRAAGRSVGCAESETRNFIIVARSADTQSGLLTSLRLFYTHTRTLRTIGSLRRYRRRTIGISAYGLREEGEKRGTRVPPLRVAPAAGVADVRVSEVSSPGNARRRRGRAAREGGEGGGGEGIGREGIGREGIGIGGKGGDGKGGGEGGGESDDGEGGGDEGGGGGGEGAGGEGSGGEGGGESSDGIGGEGGVGKGVGDGRRRPAAGGTCTRGASVEQSGEHAAPGVGVVREAAGTAVMTEAAYRVETAREVAARVVGEAARRERRRAQRQRASQRGRDCGRLGGRRRWRGRQCVRQRERRQDQWRRARGRRARGRRRGRW